jgi:hypothetical protein
MTTVAQCVDLPAPPTGSAFTACTNVVWVTSSSVADLSQDDISSLFVAALVLFATVFVWRVFRRVM